MEIVENDNNDLSNKNGNQILAKKNHNNNYTNNNNNKWLKIRRLMLKK